MHVCDASLWKLSDSFVHAAHHSISVPLAPPHGALQVPGITIHSPMHEIGHGFVVLQAVMFCQVPFTTAQSCPPHCASVVTMNSSGRVPLPPPHWPEQFPAGLHSPVQFMGQGVVLLHTDTLERAVPFATGQTWPPCAACLLMLYTCQGNNKKDSVCMMYHRLLWLTGSCCNN